ncbi:hypothetical protein AB0941_35885 [Streptomyces sp. NPDC013433]|uniref:hypothetical protein n=1 Tax=Streptomyces sp. NPDC013433 TaxID=3155604 RepID=UPI0034559981
MSSQPFGLLFLVGDVPQALLQPGDLTEPLHPLGLSSEALAGVGFDLQQPGFLSQVKAEHGASDAGMLVLAWGSVGSVAGAQSNLAEAEVVAEVSPFGVSWIPVLFAGTCGSALVNEVSVMADDLLGIDRDVSLSGVEIEMVSAYT